MATRKVAAPKETPMDTLIDACIALPVEGKAARIARAIERDGKSVRERIRKGVFGESHGTAKSITDDVVRALVAHYVKDDAQATHALELLSANAPK